MDFDPYVYPGSYVLKNKFNIKDYDFLRKVERPMTAKRIEELSKIPVPKKFDYNYLKTIHQYIFQDMYDWAGEQRTVELAKNNHIFCRLEKIESSEEEIFKEIEEKKNFKNLPKEKLAEEFSNLFFPLNQLHPFREGNGRVQREFLRSVARYNGYELSFKNISEEEMINISVSKDNNKLRNKFLETLKKYPSKNLKKALTKTR